MTLRFKEKISWNPHESCVDENGREYTKKSGGNADNDGCRDTLLNPGDFTFDGQQALKIGSGEGKQP